MRERAASSHPGSHHPRAPAGRSTAIGGAIVRSSRWSQSSRHRLSSHDPQAIDAITRLTGPGPALFGTDNLGRVRAA
jgi:hypothetical protein